METGEKREKGVMGMTQGRGWGKKLKGPGQKANLFCSQLTFAPEESAEHDDCRQQE